MSIGSCKCFSSVSKSLEMMIPYLKQCARVVLSTVYLLYFHVHFTIAGLLPVGTLFMMLIFVQLAPENT